MNVIDGDCVNMALWWTVPHCTFWNATKEKKKDNCGRHDFIPVKMYMELDPLMYSLIRIFFFFCTIMLNTQEGSFFLGSSQHACSWGLDLWFLQPMNDFLICSAQWCIGEIGNTMCAELDELQWIYPVSNFNPWPALWVHGLSCKILSFSNSTSSIISMLY